MNYDDYFSEENRQKRRHRRRVISAWKEEAKAIRAADPGGRMLMREAKRESLLRIEDAARTVAQFENLNLLWDDREIVELWRVEKHETLRLNDLEDYRLPRYDTVIPAPLEHIWWRELTAGNFLDYIHDCPHELQELTSSNPMYHITKALDENRKEILYYWAIRQWSPQRIAAFRGQTDRNVRKVYHKMIEDMRKELYIRLYPRYRSGKPLTLVQWEFCGHYLETLDEKQKSKLERRLEKDEKHLPKD